MIRELSSADAERLAELERLLFAGDNPWPAQDFRAEMAQPHTAYLGIDLHGELVAYAGIAMLGPRTSPEFEIHTIGVDPSHQRKGLARALMDNIVAIAEAHHAPIFLEVRVDNDPAIAMYEAFGFERIGRRRNYYQPSGADAFTMVRAYPSQQEGAS